MRIKICVLLAGFVLLFLFIAAQRLPDLFPSDFPVAHSTQVVDRHGETLRVFTTPDGYWRFSAYLEDIDPEFIRLLLVFEDKRFWSHRGVDLLSLGRAVFQFIRHGRVVSGASTITMQTVRLLQPHRRTLSGKLFEMIQALRLERQLTKKEILEQYLTLAPYGGNIEGIEAACRFYFETNPARIPPSRAALLISLPQSPERRRPDRHPQQAQTARNNVLERLGQDGLLTTEQVQLAKTRPVPLERYQTPFLAPHLTRSLHQSNPEKELIQTTLDARLQQRLESIAAQAQQRFAVNEKKTLALMVVDNKSHQVLAHVGSGSFQVSQIDLTRARRSPGSTLKPFIYGLAFEQGILHPETMILDRPQRFGGYGPTNFDGEYHGWVSIRHALQRSLNLPAVQVLERVGPQRLLSRFAEMDIVMGQGTTPGLSLALGGIDTSLRQLVGLYSALADKGMYTPFSFTPDIEKKTGNPKKLLSPTAAWYVDDILRGMSLPAGLTATDRKGGKIRFKTGTSYGFRDAWVIGYTQRYTVGIWLGRPDGGYGKQTTGANSAVPILLQTFAALPDQPDNEAEEKPPANVILVGHSELSPGLQWFTTNATGNRQPEIPHIYFPVNGSTMQLFEGEHEGETQSITLKSFGGVPPFHWLVNGLPLGKNGEQQTAIIRYTPQGVGMTRITLIDGAGKRDKVEVWLE